MESKSVVSRWQEPRQMENQNQIFRDRIKCLINLRKKDTPGERVAIFLSHFVFSCVSHSFSYTFLFNLKLWKHAKKGKYLSYLSYLPHMFASLKYCKDHCFALKSQASPSLKAITVQILLLLYILGNSQFLCIQ